jgi:hypothetical protein
MLRMDVCMEQRIEEREGGRERERHKNVLNIKKRDINPKIRGQGELHQLTLAVNQVNGGTTHGGLKPSS